jgi:hypothetical protein
VKISKKEREALEQAKQLIEQVKSGLSKKELEALEQAKQLIEQVKERVKKELE